MKKIVTLSLVVLMASSVMAQDLRSVDNSTLRLNKSEMYSQKKTLGEASVAKTITDPAIRKARLNGETDTLYYLRPFGSFFGGSYPNGNSSYPRIYISDTTDVVFENASLIHSGDSTMVWGFTAASGQMYAIAEDKWDCDYIEAGFQLDSAGSAFYMPWLAQLDDELNVKGSFQYGSKYADRAAIIVLPDWDIAITNCATYTDTVFGGNDFYRVGFSSESPYAYGTGLKLSATLVVDTFVTTYENFGRFKADTITINVYSENAEAAKMIPAGKSVKLELFAMDYQKTEEGKIKSVYSDSLIASFDITSANIDNAEEYDLSGGSKLYVGDINLAFGAKNALGGFSPQPVVLDGPFYMVLSGMSQEGLDFGIFCDYYYPEGNTYFLAGGHSYSYNMGKGSNMAVSIHGYFTDEEAPETGVEEILSNSNNAQKVLIDGQIYIVRDGKTFNVLGAEVR